jgi:hypothetical protein
MGYKKLARLVEQLFRTSTFASIDMDIKKRIEAELDAILERGRSP